MNNIATYQLNRINANYRTSLHIYIQRVSQLVRAKVTRMEGTSVNESVSSNFRRSHTFQMDDNKIRNTNQMKLLKLELGKQESGDLRGDIEQWRKEAKMFDNLIKKDNNRMEVLSAIDSDIVSKRSEQVILNK